MPDSSKSIQDESLSALMDNEATELELHRLLKASEEDGELRQSWQRYQVIGSAMRGDLPAGNYSDLSASISAAIADEPVPESNEESNEELNATSQGSLSAGKVVKLWSSLGRMAVAASVAGAVVFGVQNYQSPLSADAANTVATSASMPSGLPAGYGAPALSARTVSAATYMPSVPERQVSFVPRQSAPDERLSKEYNAELQAYLNHLMLEHAEHAALNGSRGMLPFARVAELETKERFGE